MEAALPESARRGVTKPSSDADARRRRAFIYGLVAFLLVASLPFLPVNNYIIAAVVRALIFISLGQAWNVVAGIGGLLSLGHGVFLGIGCYTTGILFNQYGIPPWLGVWGGVVLSLLVALVMGAMTLRMRGVFFALATVAASLAMVQISRHFVDLTGGADGLALKFFGNSWWAAQSRTPAPFLYASLTFVTAYYWITRWILNSNFGLEMQAVRDDEVAAAAAGVAVFRTMAIDPEAAFGLSQAIQLQLPALIGGLGTAWGPIIGGAVMIFLSEVTNWGGTKIGVSGVDILVYGLMLLVVVLYAPKGIVGAVLRNAMKGTDR
jgi:branched-chain amino acid transport system permease protein